MSASRITIGQLASETDTNVPNIRYYEQIGLLPVAQRADNGHRYYLGEDITRLRFIKRCRDFGFPIEQVREMVRLFEAGDGPCIEIRDLAKGQLESVRGRIEQMQQLEAKLISFVASCDTGCCAGKTRDCSIVEELSAAPFYESYREVRRT